jgi:hypothetical protein
VKILFIVLRLGMAVITIDALVTTFLASWRRWRDAGYGDPTTLTVNFFSYFTIESNIVAIVVLLIGAGLLIGGIRSFGFLEPGWYGGLRGAAVTYMIITAIIYNLVLRGVVTAGVEVSWTNEVLHLIGPSYLIVDWIFAPGRHRLEWRQLWHFLVFPLVWGSYTLIRGPFVYDQLWGRQRWYPYPFLDPIEMNGRIAVALSILAIVALLALISAGVIWVSRRHEGWPLPRPKLRTRSLR